MQNSKRRCDGRNNTDLRETNIVMGVNPYAEGSARIDCGRTSVLVTASVEKGQPRWMDTPGKGWITAEYGMLPRSTHDRCQREAVGGKQSGRTVEIQRLIGRALRQAVSLEQLGEVTIRLDCDVITADGGTRTSAINAAWVALSQAIFEAKKMGLVEHRTPVRQVAAISVGVVDGQLLTDLCYEEDSNADFDMNLVFLENGSLVEIQGTAEQRSCDVSQLTSLLGQSWQATKELMEIQKKAIGSIA